MISIDTIRLYCNIHLNSKIYNNYMKGWWYKTHGEETRYYLKHNSVIFIYSPMQQRLWLNFSCTKLLYSKNTFELNVNDIDTLFNKLNVILSTVLKCSVPDIRLWSVTRLDLAYNFVCDNLKDKAIYLDILNKLSYSRCKNSAPNGCEKESIHQRNKSFVHNFYDKSAQDSTANKQILRLEEQIKNNGLNYLLRTQKIKSKNFQYIMNNLDNITKIYISRLNKLGLNKKFLTKKQMLRLLNIMLKKGEITKRKYNNMYTYYTNEQIKLHNNTLNNYKKILSTYNVSHIIAQEKITKQLKTSKCKIYYRPNKSTLITQIIELVLLHLIKKSTIHTLDLNTNKTFIYLNNKINEFFIDDS